MIIPFEFEHTHKWTKEQYVDVNRIFLKRNRWLRITVFGVFGIVCLFWAYTLILGICVLVLMALALLMPHIVAGGTAHGFRTCLYLHEALTYGVSNEKLWLNGSLIEVKVSWESVDVWDERDDWLRVSPRGSPNLWFPVSKLKDAGIFERTIELCEKHGVRFNSRAARSRHLSRPILPS